MTARTRGPELRATTILAVRHRGRVVMAGDGQVTIGQTIMKSNARKLRRLYQDRVLAGFAGAGADALTLFERFEAKLAQVGGNLRRAAVDLAKDWRTDRLLRRLEALLVVADRESSLVVSGNGDVIEPEDGVCAIGSGGNFALAAARVLVKHAGDLPATSSRSSATSPRSRSTWCATRGRRRSASAPAKWPRSASSTCCSRPSTPSDTSRRPAASPSAPRPHPTSPRRARSSVACCATGSSRTARWRSS